MADSFGKNWIDKSHERIERMQDASNEEDTENQRLLDEVEIEYGHVDDRTGEMEDYPSDPDDIDESNFRSAFENADNCTLDQRLEDAVDDEDLDYHLQSVGMITDNDLPEGSEMQESDPGPASSASPNTPQYGPENIPGLTNFNHENLEMQDTTINALQASTGAQDEEFDFDGAYLYTNLDTFMQKGLEFLRRHPEVRGAALQEFHRQLLDRNELAMDLDELEKLLQ